MSSAPDLVQATPFDAARVRPVVAAWWAAAGLPGRAPEVADYASFRRGVPVTTKDAYGAAAEGAWIRRGSARFHVGGSSGTSSAPKLVLSRVPVPGQTPSEADRALVRDIRAAGILRDGDVVGNCFGLAHFSILHDGMNSIFEACRCSMVPVGTLEAGSAAEAQLRFMAAHGVNVLAGTPSSLVQVAHAARTAGVVLDIERVVFTGEALGAAKASFLSSVFPDVRAAGLYGLSECGFIGIGGDDGYRVRDTEYLLEHDHDGVLLVTALDPDRPVPILRYRTGDRVELLKAGTGTALRSVARAGSDFNYMGNLVELDALSAVVARVTGAGHPLVQVQLDTDDLGRDRLLLRVLDDMAADCLDTLRRAVADIPELREAAAKGAGSVEVLCCAVETAALTPRAKHRHIVDLR